MTDYSKIENQIGCGWCAHETTCHISIKWKTDSAVLDRKDRYDNRPCLTCGKFVHHTRVKKIYTTTLNELISLLSAAEKAIDNTTIINMNIKRRLRIMKKKLEK